MSIPGFFPGSWGGGGVAPLTLATLAERDGWWAMYDPNNSAFRTLSGGQVFTTLADSLGNGPDLINATAENRPEIWADRFGSLDALHAPAMRTLSATVSPSIAAPYFVAGIFRVSADELARDLYTLASPARRGSLRVNTVAGLGAVSIRGAGGVTDLASGGDVVSESANFVFGALYDGASSEIWIDSELVAEGSTTNGNISRIVLLAQEVNSATNSWVGDLGPFAIYVGAPSAAVRNRMFAFLHEQSGIAPF